MASHAPTRSLRPGTTVSRRIRVTERRTVDYMDGDSFIVPVGAMVDVDALEEQIATSRIYSTPALVRDIEDVAKEAMAPALERSQTSAPIRMALDIAKPTLIDSWVTVNAAVAAVDGARVTFDITATDQAGNVVATARHEREVTDGTRLHAQLAALRDATKAVAAAE